MLEQGISVSCVLPGWYLTPITDLGSSLRERFDKLPKEVQGLYEKDAPERSKELLLKTRVIPGQPFQMAHIITWICCLQ